MEFMDFETPVPTDSDWHLLWETMQSEGEDLFQELYPNFSIAKEPKALSHENSEPTDTRWYEPGCPYRRDTGAPLEDHGTLKFRLIEVFQDFTTYIGDSLGGWKYIDVEEERTCTESCRCRMHDSHDLADNFIFVVHKDLNECTVMVNDTDLLYELRDVLGAEHILPEFIRDQCFQKINGFVLLQHFLALRERLEFLETYWASQQTKKYLCLKLLVDDFLADGDVFRSFGFESLYEQGFISFTWWNKFQQSRLLQDMTALDEEFWAAETESLSSDVDLQSTLCGQRFSDEDAITESDQLFHAPQLQYQLDREEPSIIEEPSSIESDWETRNLMQSCSMSRNIGQYILENLGTRLAESQSQEYYDYRRMGLAFFAKLLSTRSFAGTFPLNQNFASVPPLLRLLYQDGCTRLKKYFVIRNRDRPEFEEAFCRLLFEAAKDGRTDVIRVILECDFPFQGTFDSRYLSAAEGNDRKSIRLLLASRAGAHGPKVHDALVQAALHGHADIVELLVDRALGNAKPAWKLILASMLLEEGRKIRLRSVYKKFKAVQLELQAAMLRKVELHRYSHLQDYRLAWESGMTTFRNILGRTLPNSTEDVLAFLCVSAAISSTLDTEKGYDSVSRIELFRRDLARWESLIPASELYDYQEIVAEIWDGYNPELVQYRCEANEVANGTPEQLKYFQSLALRMTCQARWLCDASQTLDSGILASQWKWREKADTNKITIRGSKRTEVVHPDNPNEIVGRQKRSTGSMKQSGTQDVSSWKPPENIEMLMIIMMGAIFICALQFLLSIRLLPLYLSLAITKEPRSTSHEKELNPLKAAVTFLHRCRVLEACLEIPLRWCKTTKTEAPDDGGDGSQSASNTSPLSSVSEGAASRGLDTARKAGSDSAIIGDAPSMSSNSPPEPASVKGLSSRFSSKPVDVGFGRGSAQYACENCHMQFSSKSNLARHRREKKEKRIKELRHTCLDCGKNFARNDYLKKHRANLEACRKRQRRKLPQQK